LNGNFHYDLELFINIFDKNQSQPMNKKTAYIVIVCFFYNFGFTQELFFGTNNYIEYQKGTLSIVISVPHGGSLEPAVIPNRTCNDPVFATDVNTIETALAIKAALFEQTGCYPHLIISHLKRSKLDCNRNVADGACGNAAAVLAWTEFQAFISTAQAEANLSSDSNTIFIDLHGHGNPIQRIELGYLLYDDELALSDATLNTTSYLNYSSIKNLVLNNQNNASHAQLLRGPNAFGTLLGVKGYPSVPSGQIPIPAVNSNYYSGGYITANHTCYAPNNVVNGFQMELNFSGIRDSALNRQNFADSLALVLEEYWHTHRNVEINLCGNLNLKEHDFSSLSVYPNPISNTTPSIYIMDLYEQEYEYTIHNSLGQLHSFGKILNRELVFDGFLSNGIYLLKIRSTKDGLSQGCKIIVK
jgi:hypothetical protein